MMLWGVIVIATCFVIDGILQHRDHPAIHRRTKIAYIVNWCLWTTVGVVAAAVWVNPAIAAGFLFFSAVLWMNNRSWTSRSYERRFDELCWQPNSAA